jgi:hypothetical protein
MTNDLELHKVGELALGEGEASLKVRLHERGLGNLGHDDGVNGLLGGDESGGNGSLLLLLTVESLLRLLAVLSGALEHGVSNSGNVNLGDVDGGLGSNDVRSDNAAKRDTVDLVGASDEEETRLELLQEDNASTSVATGKEDENSAGGDGGTELGGGVLSLAGLQGLGDALGRGVADVLGSETHGNRDLSSKDRQEGRKKVQFQFLATVGEIGAKPVL